MSKVERLKENEFGEGFTHTRPVQTTLESANEDVQEISDLIRINEVQSYLPVSMYFSRDLITIIQVLSELTLCL
jgi:hypothetical protein